MLAPRWQKETHLQALEARWHERGALRLEPAFREVYAASWATALRGSEHAPIQHVDPSEGFQLWRFGWTPGTDDCDHPLCLLGRWLHGPGMRWVEGLTGLALANPTRELFSDRALKSSFFDAYNERGEGRAVAYQVQLTAASWPVGWGGHLEVLEGPEGPVVETRGPAWNALDLLDVRGPSWRKMPMLTRHVDGYTVSGWYVTR